MGRIKSSVTGDIVVVPSDEDAFTDLVRAAVALNESKTQDDR